jgi:hypothetical protein
MAGITREEKEYRKFRKSIRFRFGWFLMRLGAVVVELGSYLSGINRR